MRPADIGEMKSGTDYWPEYVRCALLLPFDLLEHLIFKPVVVIGPLCLMSSLLCLLVTLLPCDHFIFKSHVALDS